MEIEYKTKDGIFCITPCPNGRTTDDGRLIKVGTIDCVDCPFYGKRLTSSAIECLFDND